VLGRRGGRFCFSRLRFLRLCHRASGSSYAGLTRVSMRTIGLRNETQVIAHHAAAWMAGSSPAMTRARRPLTPTLSPQAGRGSRKRRGRVICSPP
jgi:hypothetical protein